MMIPTINRVVLSLFAAGLLAANASSAVRWGRVGHEIVGVAAGSEMPDEMPAFFRAATEQLGWLNYDPDRWRDGSAVEANEAWQYDHFIDLEAIPDSALASPHRFAYLQALSRAGIDRPEQLGLLPFRIIEMTERLTVEFRQWRTASDPRIRGWLEQRIINDAGILGHYVADGANPHHTTIHFNGWDSDAPNPEGYTLDRTFHRRFESDYVNANVKLEDVGRRVIEPARELANLRVDVMAYIGQTHRLVRRLYDLEKAAPFSAERRSSDHKDFTVERLAAGARMLRSIWFTAWRKSADL